MRDTPTRISVDDLHNVVKTFPAEMQVDDGGRAIGLANAVIAHFLGRDWLFTHVQQHGPKTGFLRLDFSSDRSREATVFRVIDFAENLFNLQNIRGFDTCIAQMLGGAEKIESTCAELDFGRLLYVNDVSFRFVEPKMSKGADYDFEITYPDGLSVAADAKCKFEATAINPESVRNSLKKARTQLPADRPGIIFVKVPQHWITDLPSAQSLSDVAHDFLRSTGRIVSIKFYVSRLDLADNLVMHRHAFNEIANPNARFGTGRSWDIFREYSVIPSWNGMPSKWQRIFFFPFDTPFHPPFEPSATEP